MIKKSKLKKSSTQKNRDTIFLLSVAAIIGILALIQNSFGQFSDIRGYYGIRFADGQHHWPFESYTLQGANEVAKPVEYPAIIGLIMWIFSFFIEPSLYGGINYYRLTASFNIIIFCVTTYILFRLSGRREAWLFISAPAVAYSLHRNWDIWAIVTMLLAIYFLKTNHFRRSAIFLGISIATKFFPLILLVPVLLYIKRIHSLALATKYFFWTCLTWSLVNLPFILVNFNGWLAFYYFNYKREIGSASIFEVTSVLGFPLPSEKLFFYLFNILSLALAGLIIRKFDARQGLYVGCFLFMFMFMLFNKQYSMQYVIWLSVLAAIAMYGLTSANKRIVLPAYFIWQLSELIFQYSFFQNILTRFYQNSPEMVSIKISTEIYALTGIFRYLAAMVFAFLLAFCYHRQQKIEQKGTASR